MSSPLADSYRPQLDSLRAIAVAGVLLAHFSPSMASWWNTGSAGVGLFFVLSGFLITGILLRIRDRIDAGASGLPHELWIFYVKRSLRIFPLYYGVIALACLLNIEDVRSHAGLLISYTYNFKVWWTGEWNRLTAHFWTLAVEEQFYLFWPWLVLLTPRRVLPWLIGSLIPLSLFFRIAAEAEWFGLRAGLYHVLLPSCCDLLACGALLAWAEHNRLLDTPRAHFWIRVVGLAGFCGFLWHNHLLHTVPRGLWPRVWENSFDALVFAAIVWACARGVSGTIGRILSASPLVYLGKISYGIYVYHNFMHYFGPGLSRRLFGVRYFSTEWLHVLWLSLCTVVCAVISYHLFERRILDHKDRLANSLTFARSSLTSDTAVPKL